MTGIYHQSSGKIYHNSDRVDTGYSGFTPTRTTLPVSRLEAWGLCHEEPIALQDTQHPWGQ